MQKPARENTDGRDGRPLSDALNPADMLRLGDGGPLPPDASELPYRRFERIASERPDLVAVVDRRGSLTYGELDGRANGLARRLRELGAGPEQIVAICLPRTADAIVAVYAVHKAGAAYLPLDPNYPAERRLFMLEDSGARLLVTNAAASDRTLTAAVDHVVDPAGVDVGARPDWEPARPADLAYLIYTSGSTGRPKGVLIEQRALAAFVSWGLATFGTEELAALLGSTSMSFDMSGFELFVPLCASGSLVLVDNVFAIESAPAPITMVNTVPSLMAALLRDVRLPATVGTVCFCGETLPPHVADRVHAQPGVRRVVNTYGPTEDTIYSTGTEVRPAQAPTIGRPFPGTQAYVLDADGQLAPRGAIGELYLGGAGLARGYHGRPELTRERFVDNPIAGAPSPRLYRTGDLARWEDGDVLQHLGRIDDQIKIRGVRIEPAEVERVLIAQPRVARAAVAARPGPSGDTRLIAWIETEGAAPAPTALRTALRRELPEPMIPSLFVPIEAMPLNANGKLDRRRLPDPEPEVRGSSPAGEVEGALAELWMAALSLDAPPGPEDNFFDLGGQSLLGFHLMEMIERRFGLELPTNALVEATTLRELADVVRRRAVPTRELVALNPDGAETPFVYLFAGPGGPFTARHFSHALGPDRPTYGIEVYGDVDGHRDERAVRELALDRINLLRAVQPHGPYLLSGHSTGGSVAFEMASLLRESGESVDLLVLIDQSAPHTLRWRGRVNARAVEVLGTGPEERRSGMLAAAARRAVRSRYEEAGPAEQLPGAVGPDWLRALRDREREHRPSPYRGPVVVFTTRDTARYTGSASLGWDRYVETGLEVERMPGDHLTILVPPNVELLAAAIRGHVAIAERASYAAAG